MIFTFFALVESDSAATSACRTRGAGSRSAALFD
jgi:hypothetical protein